MQAVAGNALWVVWLLLVADLPGQVPDRQRRRVNFDIVLKKLIHKLFLTFGHAHSLRHRPHQ